MSEIKSHAAVGRSGRLLAARLLPGQDMVNGLIELITANGIKSGIVTALGSLRCATVLWAKTVDFKGDLENEAVFLLFF